jgi:hypothetical protein
MEPAAPNPDSERRDRCADSPPRCSPRLTCDDGNVYQASFNGGPVAFHLDTGGLYIWKEIQFVTPTGESGVLTRGLQGFAAEPTVTCTYIGAVSGNDYTVIGFYASK